MTLDEKTAKTLVQLGVNGAPEVEALFAEAHTTLAREKQELIGRGANDESERERLCRGLRDRWLARKNGLISRIDGNWLKPASRELKPLVGRQFNQLRQNASEVEVAKLLSEVPVRRAKAVTEKLPDVTEQVEVRAAKFETALTDLTLPGYHRTLGSIHPVTRVQREIEEIFLGLGFSIETGPEIETVFYNFDALNIPESHPSRDDWDTLYIDSETLLRTHTSPVQIRAMEKHGAPLYIICPGKCYRHDNPDSSHSPMFHQIEGLAVDTDISFADLKGTLDFFAKKFFGEEIRTNFVPSFFPFTEPSGELAISCVICGGQGCSVCKESGWVEVMGCGMVHPDVLRNGGIDPERYCGWAFGLGIERFAMMKYGVNDIQLFFQSDLRFLEQF